MAARLPTSAVVEKLKLKPHPEGGFFAETFRDDSIHLTLEQLQQHSAAGASAAAAAWPYRVGRVVSTAIYFLLPSGFVSHLHRIPSQEVWHFYTGDPLTVLELEEVPGTDKVQVRKTVLGQDLAAGQLVQHVVRGGVWFGAFPTLDYDSSTGETVAAVRTDGKADVRYSLVGCTVAPAFEFADFELLSGDKSKEIAGRLSPSDAKLVLALTAKDTTT